MDSEDELKEIDIKTCKCYYFDNIIRVWYTNIYVVMFHYTENYVMKNK